MKKTIYTMMTALTLMILILIGQQKTVLAAEKKLNTNQEYQLQMVPGGSETYTFKMPKGGYIYYEVTLGDVVVDGEKKDEGGQIRSSISVKGKIIDQDRIGIYIGQSFESNELAFAPGETVEINLYDKDFGNYYSEKDKHYDIRLIVHYVKKSNFEKENNNSKKKSNSIKRNKTGYGVIMSKEDVDYYCFKAPKTGKYNITATIDNLRDYQVFQVDVLKGSKTVKSININYLEGSKKTGKISLKKGQKIYIKVSSPATTNIGFGAGGSVVYKLKVK